MLANEIENLNDGIQTDKGIPLAIAIEEIINTLVHLSVVILIWTSPLSFKYWKKSVYSLIALPNFFGFGFWIIDNNR